MLILNVAGDILGATELRGPTNFSYRDLKSATKNFKEENKLGEGGFGDVYKVRILYLHVIMISWLISSTSTNIAIMSI